MPHPYSSMKILALLEHSPRSAIELSNTLGTSPRTVRIQTQKLLKWGQLEVSDERIQAVPTGNVRLDGKPIITQIRTRLMKTTDRGRARLAKKGGHGRFCPECAGGKRKR